MTDDVSLPEVPVGRGTGVPEPEHVAEEILDDHDVGMAVLVDVSNGMAFESLRVITLDKMFLKNCVSLVFVPVKTVVREGVGTSDVEVSVAVYVSSRDTKGIRVAGADQVFLETWWLGSSHAQK